MAVFPSARDELNDTEEGDEQVRFWVNQSLRLHLDHRRLQLSLDSVATRVDESGLYSGEAPPAFSPLMIDCNRSLSRHLLEHFGSKDDSFPSRWYAVSSRPTRIRLDSPIAMAITLFVKNSLPRIHRLHNPRMSDVAPRAVKVAALQRRSSRSARFSTWKWKNSHRRIAVFDFRVVFPLEQESHIETASAIHQETLVQSI